MDITVQYTYIGISNMAKPDVRMQIEIVTQAGVSVATFEQAAITVDSDLDIHIWSQAGLITVDSAKHTGFLYSIITNRLTIYLEENTQ